MRAFHLDLSVITLFVRITVFGNSSVIGNPAGEEE
jgi:hypothetical protein